MLILDAHCDTLTRIMEDGSNLYHNNCHTDLERMKQNGGFIQFYAAFIHPAYCQAYAMRRAIQIIDTFYRQLEQYPDNLMLCRNYSDIESAVSTGRVAALLSIEGGDALQGELSALRMFYRLGVRSLCLTWNYRNEIADGVLDGESGGGLTPFGRQVVQEMNRLGMLVDVSHLAEKGFWDVMENTGKPIIASHSNAHRICGNKRNLTDRQIGALKGCGGVMGINFYPAFLTGDDRAGLSDIVRHIEYIAALGGEDILGLGADFDGISHTPDEIQGVQDLHRLFEALARLNYSQTFLDKLAGQNFLRVIRQVLG